MTKGKEALLLTPDGRYLVVRGRLWRRANPALPEAERQELVRALMAARRAVAAAQRQDDAQRLREARAAVQRAKEGLGERGPVWWDDGAPDYTRHLAHNSPYRDWYAEQAAGASQGVPDDTAKDSARPTRARTNPMER